MASTRRLLHKWMRDEHLPSRDYVRRLSLIFDKPESYFTASPPASPSPLPAEAEKEALTLVWRQQSTSSGRPAIPSPGGRGGRSRSHLQGFPRSFIASQLAPNFVEDHILLERVIGVGRGNGGSRHLA